jgi:catechol 2,3-dioxygenase-like lactoylglutathione lyase family enzyme
MIQTTTGHVVFMINPDNAGFYKDLLTFLGWQPIYEGNGSVGMAGANSATLWFMGEAKPIQNDYDGPGMNHFAFSASTQADVDMAAQHLTEQGVALLFDTPRHRPEFSGEGSTYYQIMFESPDRILFEIVYMGPKDQ